MYAKILIFLSLSTSLLAQPKPVALVKGIIFKKGMMEKVANARVTNLNTYTTTTSNLYGEFSAKVSVGDTLLVECYGYTAYKQLIGNFDNLFISLLPAVMLNEVTITGQTKKQELNGIINGYRSKGIYFDGKPPLTAYLPVGGKPLTVLHELFGKTAIQEKRFMKFARRENDETTIDRKYTPELVAKNTGLKGDSLRLFMLSYRPSHDDIVKWADYETIIYIKKSYESFKKTGQLYR